MTLEIIIKALLAALLFLCLLDLPYGYYQFVRFAAAFGFGFLAFDSYEKKKQTGIWIYLGLALLFQPFFKIALGRQLWNIIDVLVGLGLLLTLKTKK